jgi:hypothetical protein
MFGGNGCEKKIRCDSPLISEDWIWRLATVKFPYLKRTETMPEAHVGERFTGWSQTNR